MNTAMGTPRLLLASPLRRSSWPRITKQKEATQQVARIQTVFNLNVPKFPIDSIFGTFKISLSGTRSKDPLKQTCQSTQRSPASHPSSNRAKHNIYSSKVEGSTYFASNDEEPRPKLQNIVQLFSKLGLILILFDIGLDVAFLPALSSPPKDFRLVGGITGGHKTTAGATHTTLSQGALV